MRSGIRRNLLWAVPLAVLAAALGLRLGDAGLFAPIQQAAWDALASMAKAPLHRLALAPRLEDGFTAVAGLSLVLIFARAQTAYALSLLVTAIALGVAFAYRMATADGLFFDPASPAVLLGATFVAGGLTPLLTGAGEEARLKSAVGSHIAPAARAAIARQPDLLKPKGETRTLSYLVVRVRRYPQLVSSFGEEPEAFRRLMRRIVGSLAECVLKYHGAVDRPMPDGLTAFFNAPVEDANHAQHACECALAMTRALEGINQSLESERHADGLPYAPVEIGIGVHAGPGIVGDFGLDSRPTYSVGGTGLPLAAELAELGAKYGPAIVASEATRQVADRNFAFLEVDTVLAQNATEPVKVFALLGNPLFRASPKFRALATFHEHIFQEYRNRQWGKTRALIEQCRQLSGASPQLYDLYLRRIAWFEAHPPEENWNGAVQAPIA